MKPAIMKPIMTESTQQHTGIAAVTDENGSLGHARMVLERDHGEGVQFSLSLQGVTQGLCATVPIAVCFAVTGDEAGFVVPGAWLDFPIFDHHGNTLLWSQSEEGDFLLTLTLKEGQSVLDVSLGSFHADDAVIDLHQALHLRLVSVNPLDVNGDPLEGPVLGLEPGIATGDPVVPYLSVAGDEHLPFALADVDYNSILLPAGGQDVLLLEAQRLGGMDCRGGQNTTLRFDDLFGDTEGSQSQPALDDLLGNLASYAWTGHMDVSGGQFTAMDGKGAEITLSIVEAVATLTVASQQDGTIYTQNVVDLQGIDFTSHDARTLDGQAFVHMLQELIKIGGSS